MFLFYVFWPRGMWDLNFPTRNQTHTSCIGSLDRWAYREVLQMCLLLCQRRLGRERCLSIFNTQVHLFICLPWGCIYSVISWLREIMSIEFVLGKRQVQKGIFFFFFFLHHRMLSPCFHGFPGFLFCSVSGLSGLHEVARNHFAHILPLPSPPWNPFPTGKERSTLWSSWRASPCNTSAWASELETRDACGRWLLESCPCGS